MKIDSGLSGYNYQNRTYAIDRKVEEAPQREVEAPARTSFGITGSSTLLSSSLANALWITGDGKETPAATTEVAAAEPAPALPSAWVKELYLEFIGE